MYVLWRVYLRCTCGNTIYKYMHVYIYINRTLEVNHHLIHGGSFQRMIKPSLKSWSFGKPNPFPKEMVVGVGLPRSRIHTLTPGPIYLSESWLTCVWFVWLRKKKQLVGGWTNPFEKYVCQNGFIFPPIFGVNIKKYLKPPPKQVECWCQLGWEKKNTDVTGKTWLSSHWIKFRRNTCWDRWNQGFQVWNLHFGAPKKPIGIFPVLGSFSPQTIIR